MPSKQPPQSSSPSNPSQQQQQQQKKKDQKQHETIIFDDNELSLLNSTSKDLNIDVEDQTDLLNLPNPDKPVLSPSDLDKIIKDPDTKTLLRDPGNDPNIMDTLSDNNIVSTLSKEQIDKINEDHETKRYELVLRLAANKKIKLHTNAGMKDGKTVWIEQEFYFNSYDKRQELHMNLLNARMRSIASKHAILAVKPITDMSEDDKNFLMYSQMMIEIAAYRVSEYEAKIKFGMTSEHFASVQMEEFDIARLAFEERIKHLPSYRPMR